MLVGWGNISEIAVPSAQFCSEPKTVLFWCLSKANRNKQFGEGLTSLRACPVPAFSASLSTSFGPKCSPGVSKPHAWVSILLSSGSLAVNVSFPESAYSVWTCVRSLGLPLWSSKKEPETIRNGGTFRPTGAQRRWRGSPVLLKTAFYYL